MPQSPIIIFVCEHGAAKSVIAAAYFNKLAGERNLNLRAISRGTTPDAELSPKTVEGLKNDGLTPIGSNPKKGSGIEVSDVVRDGIPLHEIHHLLFIHYPKKLSLADVESAQRIVTFCELPEEYQNKVTVEQWNGVPLVSENYEQARDVIIEHINQLLKK